MNLVTILPLGGASALYENTLIKAWDNVCDKTGMFYEASLPMASYNDISQNVMRVEPSDVKTIFFIQWDDWFENESYAELLRRRPNGKIVLFSADTVYLRHRYRLNRDLISLHIDTLSSECYLVAKNFGIDTQMFYWTVSESTIKQIEEMWANGQMSTNKIYDGISLCRQYPTEADMDRTRFFKYLGKQSNILTGINEFDLNKVFRLYSECWTSVGTSTSTITTHPGTRSMKGFRDWIAPFCNCLLIYDDHEDMMNISCVPKYQYMNVGQCSSLIEHYKTSTQFPILIEEQKKWARSHTIENQLLGILTNDLFSRF